MSEQQQGINAQKLELQTADGLIDTWLFKPEGTGKWPAIILNTDIKGVRDTFINMGKRLASNGYVVLLPNLYYRVAVAPVIDATASLQDEKYKERFNELRAAVSIPGLYQDHKLFLNFLTKHESVSSPRIGIVGYCMSGAIALRAAADFPENIVAAASFHGGRLATDALDSPHLRAKEIRARLHLGYAQNDASMSDEMIAKLETALSEAHVKVTSEHYLGRHGFAVADSAAYNPDISERHWQNLIALFHSTLHSNPHSIQD